MGAVITNKDGYGWDNFTTMADKFGRYFGTASAGFVITGLDYAVANSKTIYVQNHTFAPVRIDKAIRVSVMADEICYSCTTVPMTMTITYTVTGMLGGTYSGATAIFSFPRAGTTSAGTLQCVAGEELMGATLDLSGYASNNVTITITSVVVDWVGTAAADVPQNKPNPGDSTDHKSSGHIAIYPMHEAGV